ncbi:hypothetical protein Tsubulata_002930, partial [Turnera subulata]
VTIEARGWAPIKDAEDPHVREVAQYAVSEHGRLKHLQLKLDKVVEGETQKDSGITYRLVLTVEEKGADTKDYTVVVVEENAKLHLKSFKKEKSKKLHIAMVPWFAYGHMIPFLHLSNTLAGRGHKVSFLFPNSAHQRLAQENQYPHLLSFFPVTVPHVDGLPPGAETTSDIPLSLFKHLYEAFDKTRPQVQSYLRDLKPDFVVFTGMAPWIPGLAREDKSSGGGFKTVRYSVVNPIIEAFYLTPSRKMDEKTTTVDDLMCPPPGFPSSTIHIARHESQQAAIYSKDYNGFTFYDRLTTSFREADVIATRTYREVEGVFFDYVAEQYAKPSLFTGPLLPKTSATTDEKWNNWLNKFEVGSVVYCAFGSQIILEKDQFQELVLGFELTGRPFLVALSPPQGCATVDEALPEGFEERVQGRGWVYGGWVPQTFILEHPSTGCVVSHFGYGSMWESLMSKCQVVVLPFLIDQLFSARWMVKQLKVAVEVERDENMWVAKENLSQAINLVMDEESEIAAEVKSNHANLRSVICSQDKEERYLDSFIQGLQLLLESKN